MYKKHIIYQLFVGEIDRHGNKRYPGLILENKKQQLNGVINRRNKFKKRKIAVHIKKNASFVNNILTFFFQEKNYITSISENILAHSVRDVNVPMNLFKAIEKIF